MNAGLLAAIERLYATFADYALEEPSRCPTCYPPAEVERIEHRLRTTPLRALTLDDLSHFYQDGLLTWGGVDDFRHLLPRLMELFAAYHLGEEVAWSGDEVTLRVELEPDLALLRFVEAAWWTWPERERSAVDGFLFELWSAHLARTGAALEPGAWLDEHLPEAILRTVADVEPYLRAWRGAGWAGTRHLAWFIVNDELSSWLTWEEADSPSTMPSWERVRRWLDDPETAAQLEDAARVAAPRDMAWEAVLALEMLGRGPAALPFQVGQRQWDETSRRRADALGVVLPPLPVPPATAPSSD